MSATLYWTDGTTLTLNAIDTSTFVSTQLATFDDAIDDLVGVGTKIYVVGIRFDAFPFPVTVHVYDVSSHAVTVLATTTSQSGNLVPVGTEPSGASILLSIDNSVVRVSLSTGAVTNLHTFGATVLPDEPAYDKRGNLFVLTDDFSNNHIVVYQLDPVSGSVLNASTPLVQISSLDSLCYDEPTDRLYAWDGGLTAFRVFDPVSCQFVATIPAAVSDVPDAIASNGDGNLYLAAFNSIHRFNLTTRVVTTTLHSSTMSADGCCFLSGVAAPLNFMFDNWGGSHNTVTSNLMV